MHQEQAIEFVHRPRASTLPVAFGICAAFILIGIAGIWLGGDRLSSMRVGMLGALAAFGVIGMIAVPWMTFASRNNTVNLGASELSVRDGSKVEHVAWKDIESIDLSGEAGALVLKVTGGGREFIIREEWLDSAEAFRSVQTEVLIRQAAASRPAA